MKKVTVFGSFNLDMSSRVDHFPKPGETMIGLDFETGPGGKGCNQAIAAKRAGADVVFATKVGKDSFAKLARGICEKEGLDLSYMYEDDTLPTGSAYILLEEASRQNMIVVNKGACSNFRPEDMAELEALFAQTDILLMQLETNLDSVETAAVSAKKAGALVVLNPAPAAKLSPETYKYIDIITPNETEAEILTGIKVDSEESAAGAAEKLKALGVRQVVITLGSKGAYVDDGSSAAMIPCKKVQAVDTTGAGDTFNGAMVAALAEGKTLFDAAAFGCAAATLSVTKRGAAMSAPMLEDIVKFI